LFHLQTLLLQTSISFCKLLQAFSSFGIAIYLANFVGFVGLDARMLKFKFYVYDFNEKKPKVLLADPPIFLVDSIQNLKFKFYSFLKQNYSSKDQSKDQFEDQSKCQSEYIQKWLPEKQLWFTRLNSGHIVPLTLTSPKNPHLLFSNLIHHQPVEFTRLIRMEERFFYEKTILLCQTVEGTTSNCASSISNSASSISNSASSISNCASSISNCASSISNCASSISNSASSIINLICFSEIDLINHQNLQTREQLFNSKLSILNELKFPLTTLQHNIFTYRDSMFTEIIEIRDVTYTFNISDLFDGNLKRNIDLNFEKLDVDENCCFVTTGISPFSEPRFLVHPSALQKFSKSKYESWIFKNKKNKTLKFVRGIIWKVCTGNAKHGTVQLNCKNSYRKECLDLIFDINSIKIDEIAKLNTTINGRKLEIWKTWCETNRKNIQLLCPGLKHLPTCDYFSLSNMSLDYNLFISMENLTILLNGSIGDLIRHYFRIVESSYEKVVLRFHPDFLRNLKCETAVVTVIKITITNKNTVLVQIIRAKNFTVAFTILLILRYIFTHFSENSVKSTKDLKLFDRYLFKQATKRGGFTRSCTDPKSVRGVLGIIRDYKRPVPLNLNLKHDRELYEKCKHKKPILRYRNNDYACINDELQNAKVIEEYNSRCTNPKQKIKYYNMPFLTEIDPEKYLNNPNETLYFPCCEMQKEKLCIKKLDVLRKVYKKGEIEILGEGAEEWLKLIQDEEEVRDGSIIHYVIKSYSSLSLHHFAHLPAPQFYHFVKQQTPNFKRNRMEYIRKGVVPGYYQILHACFELVNYGGNYRTTSVQKKKDLVTNFIDRHLTYFNFSNYRRLFNYFHEPVSYEEWLHKIFNQTSDTPLNHTYLSGLLSNILGVNFIVFDYQIGHPAVICKSSYIHSQNKKFGFVMRFRESYEAIVLNRKKKQIYLFESENQLVQKTLEIIKSNKSSCEKKYSNILGQQLNSFNLCKKVMKLQSIISSEKVIKIDVKDKQPLFDIPILNYSKSNNFDEAMVKNYYLEDERTKYLDLKIAEEKELDYLKHFVRSLQKEFMVESIQQKRERIKELLSNIEEFKNAPCNLQLKVISWLHSNPERCDAGENSKILNSEKQSSNKIYFERTEDFLRWLDSIEKKGCIPKFWDLNKFHSKPDFLNIQDLPDCSLNLWDIYIANNLQKMINTKNGTNLNFSYINLVKIYDTITKKCQEIHENIDIILNNCGKSNNLKDNVKILATISLVLEKCFVILLPNMQTLYFNMNASINFCDSLIFIYKRGELIPIEIDWKMKRLATLGIINKFKI
jgi:hypothetical protein